jgi:hypothetical protein
MGLEAVLAAWFDRPASVLYRAVPAAYSLELLCDPILDS